VVWREILASELYVPNQEIQKEISETSLISLIGPSASGKNFVLCALEKANSRYKKVISHTTRLRRQDERSGREYHFNAHSHFNRKIILERANRGEYVQFIEHPTTGYFYWSQIENWNDQDYSTLDTLPIAYDALVNHQFKDRHAVMLVPQDTDFWLEKFLERTSNSLDDRQKRLQEGIDSYEWGADRGDQVQWIINEVDRERSACMTIVAIAVDGYPLSVSNSARRLGRNLLDLMKDMQISK